MTVEHALLLAQGVEVINRQLAPVARVVADGDPEAADIPIPGNDDSMRSIDVIVREICLAIADGEQSRTTSAPEASADDAGADEGKPRRSSRAQFRADDSNVSKPEPANAGSDAPAPAQAES